MNQHSFHQLKARRDEYHRVLIECLVDFSILQLEEKSLEFGVYQSIFLADLLALYDEIAAEVHLVRGTLPSYK